MRRRLLNQMRAVAAPVAAHPSAPVEQPQQAPAVSVPPAPPGPPLTEAQVLAWAEKLDRAAAAEWASTFSARTDQPKRKPGRPRKVRDG